MPPTADIVQMPSTQDTVQIPPTQDILQIAAQIIDIQPVTPSYIQKRDTIFRK
jgi:hypothetical protein